MHCASCIVHDFAGQGRFSSIAGGDRRAEDSDDPQNAKSAGGTNEVQGTKDPGGANEANDAKND